MSLLYLGIGLSRTGTKSLRRAMEILGFTAKHWHNGDPSARWPFRLSRVVLGLDGKPPFKELYGDCQFIGDIPHAYFYREILADHPSAKCILTVRDENAWFRSMCQHYGGLPQSMRGDMAGLHEAALLQQLVYGTGTCPPDLSGFFSLPEFLYKKRFNDWNDSARLFVPKGKLLVVDVTSTSISSEHKWQSLCDFVQRPVPNIVFPHE